MANRNNPPPDKTLSNGVVVKGTLQINELTLREHQEYLNGLGQPTLSYEEAKAAGFPEDELAKAYPLAVQSPTN